MKTIGGVYLDLEESDYIFEYKDYKFYFSSNFYLEKFKTLYQDCIGAYSLQLNSKYDQIIDAENIILLKIYKKIEKRGFKVTYKNKDIPKKSYFKVEFVKV